MIKINAPSLLGGVGVDGFVRLGIGRRVAREPVEHVDGGAHEPSREESACVDLGIWDLVGVSRRRNGWVGAF